MIRNLNQSLKNLNLNKLIWNITWPNIEVGNLILFMLFIYIVSNNN